MYLIFAATGVGVALPGVLLPVLMARWQLKDEQGGVVLLFSFLGSSLSNLLIRGSLRATMGWGAVLTTLSCWGFAELSLKEFPWIVGVFGLGMGLVMTSISLVRRKHTLEPEREFIRLNLAWALGALVCPALAARVFKSGNTQPLLAVFGLFFLLAAGWIFSRGDVRVEKPAVKAGGRHWWDSLTAVPVVLLMMAFLVTGIESATSGWLSTYAARESGRVAVTVAAPSAMWAGLLVSRLFWSLPQVKLTGWRVTLGSAGLLAVSACLLVASGGGVLMLVAAFGVGFGLGPVFPMLLVEALKYRESGAVFLIAGLGASAIPWVTGAVSQRMNSLRYGLAAPMVSAVLMLVLAVAYRARGGIRRGDGGVEAKSF
jgi:fucose permease